MSNKMEPNRSETVVKVEQSPKNRDSRGRDVIGTVAEQNGKMCFVCATCDADFVDFAKYEVHVDLHRAPKESVQSTVPPTVQQPPKIDVECISLVSSDEENDSNEPDSQKNAPKAEHSAARTRGKGSSSAEAKVSPSRAEKRSRPNDDSEAANDKKPSEKRSKDQTARSTNSSDDSFEELYNCKCCKKKFDDLLELNLHRKDCTKWNKMFSACEFCSEAFPNKKGKLRHQKNHHQKELPEHCKLCANVFATKKELVQHKQKQHATGLPVQCHFCSKWFNNHYEKNEHVKSQHPFGEFDCNVCGKTVKTEKALNEHKESAHPKAK